MRTIAIALCDNDFSNTFRPLLESIYNVLIWRGDEATEEKIREYIYHAVRYHYIAFQSRDDDVEDVVCYLQGKMRIYFDKEAEDYMIGKDHDGGSWYLEVRTGRFYSF